MRTRRIETLLMTFAILFVFMPMIARAEENSVNTELGTYQQSISGFKYSEGEIALRSTPDGMCHCGAPREKTEYTKVEMAICPLHGPSCDRYFGVYTRNYYYCTNPSCGDSWYDSWSLVRFDHT